MSDKWETVVAPKRKPGKSSQQQQPQKVSTVANGTPGAFGATRVAKVRKHSAKTPASFPLAEDVEDESVHAGGGDRKDIQGKKDKISKKKVTTAADKPKEKKRDLQGMLANYNAGELLSFFKELESANYSQEVCLSWIKYSADALNTKINQSSPIFPELSLWTSDLNYPTLTSSLSEVLRTIISKSCLTRQDVDVRGIAFTSLITALPSLVQRGDAGWGHLLFLRELCRIDPSLPIRKKKSIGELMESYGNRKEVGICVLWAVAQAGVESPYVLKIASQFLLPYYGFKHYKQFVLGALETSVGTSGGGMAAEHLIDGDEFEEFFEAAFDPKKKKDLEKIYPRVKELVFQGVRGHGSPIFLKFIEKIGQREFSQFSLYGKEVFDILLKCLENDPLCIDTWRVNLSIHPKESAALLSYLSKVPAELNCGDKLETKLIQSDEFAIAAVKNPELLRTAKKVQIGLERVAQAKKRLFSWKIAIFAVIILIGGLLWLDVAENGKGNFEKSNTANFLKKFGLLKEGIVVWTTIGNAMKYVREYATLLFQSIYTGLRPVLQTISAKAQEYIPQITQNLTIMMDFLSHTFHKLLNFLETEVFVGSMSPENLRRLTKQTLSMMWDNTAFAIEKVYSAGEKFVHHYLK